MAPYEFWWHGGWWFMWIVPVVFLIVFAILLLRGGPACGWGRSRESERESARYILAQRFARGEITKDQYEDMKRTLER
jgi:putative membrane protein